MSEERIQDDDLSDGRKGGEWKTRYSWTAWLQIILELIFLAGLSFFAFRCLLDGITIKDESHIEEGYVYSSLLDVHIVEESMKWVALILAGFIGGIIFDLKWLYHSVAKGIWNRDRILWRIIVPFNSSIVSLFTGFLIVSGIVPFLDNRSFDSIYALLGFGFIFGYFSDNILAALQNFARHIFGTLEDK